MVSIFKEWYQFGKHGINLVKCYQFAKNGINLVKWYQFGKMESIW